MPNNTIFIVLILAAAGVLYWFYNSRQSAGGGSGGKAVLHTYSHDLSKAAKESKLDPVIGREEEIERVIHILSRRSKNNPLLLGEPGVGKTAIVEGIARRIVAGNVPDNLKNKRILALDLGGLISGTKYRGEFEERMKRLTTEIQAVKDEVIIFIDEIHMIEQAKGAEGAMNASDILKPALSRGELHAIGATTWKEYEKFIRPDDALNRRFQPVIVGEPSEEATWQILQGIKTTYEDYHKVRYSDDALRAAIQFSKQLIKDRFLPDKAIDLLDEAGAKVAIEFSHETQHAVALLHVAGKEVSAAAQNIDVTLSKISEELEHLRSLEATLAGETELKEIREKMEHLEDEAKKLKTREEAPEKMPVVDAAVIQKIAEDWAGRR
jgi:ATP-dependent Clp protease ATP-binding subunit ClpA